MKFRVMHKDCGGQIAWWFGENPLPTDVFSSKTFERMDGSRPENGSIVKEKCPSCGKIITHAFQLKRIPE